MPMYLVSGRDEKNEAAAYEIEAADEHDARTQAKSLLATIEAVALTEAEVSTDAATILSSDVLEQAQSSIGGKAKPIDPDFKVKRILRRILMTCITLVIGIIVSNYFIRENMIKPADQHVSDASVKNNKGNLFSKGKYQQALHEYYIATGWFSGLIVVAGGLIWLGAWSVLALRELKKNPRKPVEQVETPVA